MTEVERKRGQADAAYRCALYLLQERGNASHVKAITVTMTRLDAEVEALEKVSAAGTATEGHNV